MMDGLWQGIDSVFWWVASKSLDVTLVIAVAAMLCRLGRNRMSAHGTHLVWTLVWLSFVLPGFLDWPLALPGPGPAATESVQAATSVDLPGNPEGQPSVDLTNESRTAATAQGPSGRSIDVFGWLPLLWFAGTALLAIRSLAATTAWNRHVRQMPVVDDARVQKALAAAATALNVPTLPALRWCDQLSSPAITGVFRPTVLLPRALAAGVGDHTLDHIFLHELAHIKRGDHRLNALLRLFNFAHWFNPFVYFALREIRTGQELMCDGMVVKAIGADHARSYGNTLLDLIQAAPMRPVPLTVTPAVSQRSQLTRRITMLSDNRLIREASWRLAPVVIVICLVSAVRVSVAAPQTDHAIAFETYPPNYPAGIFREGDMITIKEVVGNRSGIEEGGTYTIRGSYRLHSALAAQLSFYVTDGDLQDGSGNTTLVSQGAGDFTLTGTLEKAGAPHISFYPAIGGESFGGVYFREAVDRPAEGAPTVSIPFKEATPSWAKGPDTSGNDITILKVTGSRPHLEEGGVYVLEGRYTLADHDGARLILYATNGETEAVSYDAPNGIHIEKGSGNFRLSVRLVKKGGLHVSMYPADGGEGFCDQYIVEAGTEDIPHYLKVAKQD